MKKQLFYSSLLMFLIACNGNIKQQDLIGKWNYTSYGYANKSLDKPLPSITIKNPAIVFYSDGKAKIFSSGKILSNGTYQVEGKIIRYEEYLPNGQKRKIPFLIKELNDKELVFQTMDAEVLVITAIKENK
ncbi:hypothetical protein A5893_09765 [Pedobacter psychrophilus]|uniref:Lipocalin-like domain-containing protein n=1 Tax=Pedobacter psychrophilus TaxID=1826909 RepID=A0A179DFM3_9SPHI|nr:hypothetical protein [Pedobacter psychrophilus]OAQ39847.1 hypothetical protein A5893_09765 [Pedobacter psychrophilus]